MYTPNQSLRPVDSTPPPISTATEFIQVLRMPHPDQCNILIGLPSILLLSNPFSSMIMEKEVEVTLKSKVFAARSVLESQILHLWAVRS